MKKFITGFLALCLAVGSAVSLSGCKNEKKESIYFLHSDREFASIYNEIARSYQAEKGISLNVVTAAPDTYEESLTSEMEKSPAPTIFQISGLKDYKNWKDYCKDLKDSEIYKEIIDPAQAITDGDGVYALPFAVEGYGIIYNAEILDKYFSLNEKKVTIHSVDEVKSFATLKEIVEDMARLKGALGIDGVFAAIPLKSGENPHWQSYHASIPIYSELSERKINPASDDVKNITFEYAQNLKNIFDLYLNNSTADRKLLDSRTAADAVEEFAQGKCAMMQNGSWSWKEINKISGNAVKENNIRFLPIYTGMEDEETQGLCIESKAFFCINKNASEEQQKLAEDFLHWLFSSDTGKKYMSEELNFIAPYKTFEMNEVPKDPLAKEVMRWMMKDNITNIPQSFSNFPSQTFKDSFSAALLSYAQGDKTFDELKAQMADEWGKEKS